MVVLLTPVLQGGTEGGVGVGPFREDSAKCACGVLVIGGLGQTVQFFFAALPVAPGCCPLVIGRPRRCAHVRVYRVVQS